MITLSIAILTLVAGYWIYGRVVEKVFGMDAERPTPACTKADGVDFIVLPSWKIFLIQFLNIAGLGPIFGAIAGAMWGPVAFLWIVLGSLFAGGVHDYFSGMLSIRHEGKSIAEIAGFYLGDFAKYFMRAFTVILMVIVGAVFIIGPAKILTGITDGYLGMPMWTAIILVYYVLSTVLPIDKVIGQLYPIFGMALLFMAGGLLIAMYTTGLQVPEMSLSSFSNLHYASESFPVYPMLFVTIACGAVSGFHSTQAPIMSRCLSTERQGRGIFYGAMITEGVVALIWAAISMSFFGGVSGLNEEMQANGSNAALVVSQISNSVLGKVGGVLALLGVVAAPITSGDTSFRSARIILSDFLQFDQKPIRNRLIVSIPLFLIGFSLTYVNFGVIWRYFAWSNQALASIVLWTITVYMLKNGKQYWIALIPALFMTNVITAYIVVAPEGFAQPISVAVAIGVVLSMALMFLVMIKAKGYKRLRLQHASE